MATDFSMNAAAYAPLLKALAGAPAKRAELQIAQEKNQRERLSTLLSNMSDAAKVARQIQIQGAINKQSKLAGGPNTLAGNAATLTPETYAQGTGGITSQIQGIRELFGSNQNPGMGEVPLNPEMQANEKRLEDNVLYGAPERSTDANTGLTIESRKGIPGNRTVNPPKDGELDPLSRDYLIKRNDAFSSEIKPMIDQIKAAKQLKAITSAQIPAAGIPTIVEALKAGGLSRITQYETTAAGKDKSLWENAKQTATGLMDGTLTKVNQEQLQALSTVLEKSAQFNIEETKNSYVDQSFEEHPTVGRNKYEKSYSAVAHRQTGGSYSPGTYQKGKGLVPDKPKAGAVEDGHRFKGGDPADPKNWVKVK